MDIYKIALLGIISAILIMALKDQVPVFTVVISIIAGILIILYILPQIKEIVLEIENLIDYAGISNKYIKILLKVIGISYISIFQVKYAKILDKQIFLKNKAKWKDFNNMLFYTCYIRFSR